MSINIKDIFTTRCLMEMGKLYIKMEIFMLVNLKIIKDMVKESINIVMVMFIQEIGNLI